jgi:L-alanine-DL-glutamate epimerase-like enolase superfamily enzyme
MKWTVEEAIRAARALQPYDLTWLEEPIIPDDISGHARVMAAGGVPRRWAGGPISKRAQIGWLRI